MRIISFLTGTLIGCLFFVSCSENLDTQPPVIDVLSPHSTQDHSLTQDLIVELDFNDETGLESANWRMESESGFVFFEEEINLKSALYYTLKYKFDLTQIQETKFLISIKLTDISGNKSEKEMLVNTVE